MNLFYPVLVNICFALQLYWYDLRVNASNEIRISLLHNFFHRFKITRWRKTKTYFILCRLVHKSRCESSVEHDASHENCRCVTTKCRCCCCINWHLFRRSVTKNTKLRMLLICKYRILNYVPTTTVRWRSYETIFLNTRWRYTTIFFFFSGGSFKIK